MPPADCALGGELARILPMPLVFSEFTLDAIRGSPQPGGRGLSSRVLLQNLMANQRGGSVLFALRVFPWRMGCRPAKNASPRRLGSTRLRFIPRCGGNDGSSCPMRLALKRPRSLGSMPRLRAGFRRSRISWPASFLSGGRLALDQSGSESLLSAFARLGLDVSHMPSALQD